MPKITITESDLTSAGGLNVSSNVVYVPGFVRQINKNYILSSGDGFKISFPYQFNTVSEFKKIFAYNDGTTETFKYLELTGGGVDKGTQYALTLLSLGLPVLFDPINIDETRGKTNGVITTNKVDETSLIQGFTSNFEDHFEKLKLKNTYNIRFITSGGYVNADNLSTVASSMLSIAAERKDCLALIDHEKSNVKYALGDTTFSNGKFGTMFTPWCSFQLPSFEKSKTLGKMDMPGSFAYLTAFANSIAVNNASWLAVAGVARGTVPYMDAPLVSLTDADIDAYALTSNDYSGVAINPIVNINPYGVLIWGNRTLHKGTGLTASSFLNIRQLCIDIHKTLYAACKSITFEQNSDILWLKFKSLVTPLLDKMQTGDGISGYELKKKKTDKKATLIAVLRIYPVEAVEDFEITLELADEFTDITASL